MACFYHMQQLLRSFLLQAFLQRVKETIVKNRQRDGKEFATCSDPIACPGVKAIGAIDAVWMFDHLRRQKVHLLHNTVAPGVNVPGGDVSILVEGEEGVVEEEVDEALGGKAHRARHIKDPQVWTRDANVCKQFHTDRLAISKHEMIMTWTLLAIISTCPRPQGFAWTALSPVGSQSVSQSCPDRSWRCRREWGKGPRSTGWLCKTCPAMPTKIELSGKSHTAWSQSTSSGWNLCCHRMTWTVGFVDQSHLLSTWGKADWILNPESGTWLVEVFARRYFLQGKRKDGREWREDQRRHIFG